MKLNIEFHSTKTLLFLLILFAGLSFLSWPKQSDAATITQSASNQNCYKKGTSGGCPFSLNTGEYQAWIAHVFGHIEGHGGSGGSGGAGNMSACLGPNASMWNGSCYTTNNFNIGDASTDKQLDGNIGSDYLSGYSYWNIELYANDATWFPVNFWVEGRKASVDSLSASSNSVKIGDNFTVSWSTSAALRTTFSSGGPISCPDNGNQVPKSGSTNCTATGAGTAQVRIEVLGPSSTGSPSSDYDTAEISISPVGTPPPDPGPTPGPGPGPGPTPQPQPPPSGGDCSPKNQTVSVNQRISIDVASGFAPYSWSAPGADPSSDNDPNFDTFYRRSGQYTATVKHSGGTYQCFVNVTGSGPTPPPPPQPQPPPPPPRPKQFEICPDGTHPSNGCYDSISIYPGQEIQLRGWFNYIGNFGWRDETNSSNWTLCNVERNSDLPDNCRSVAEFAGPRGRFRGVGTGGPLSVNANTGGEGDQVSLNVVSPPQNFQARGYVYEDYNTTSCCGGQKDANEPGMASEQVRLQTVDGQTLSTATTDSTGFFRFTGLTPGNYRLSHTVPPGFVRTTDDSTVFSIGPDFVYSFGNYNNSVLNPPSNLTTNNSTCGQMTLNWTDNSSGENGFIILRSTTRGSEVEIARTSANRTSFTDSMGAPNTTYYYQVKAYKNNPVQESTPSNEAQGFVLECIANIQGTMTIIRINGQAYSSSTVINNGGVLTFQITLANNGPTSSVINYLCDLPSSNVINIRNLNVTGGGANGGITASSPSCSGNPRLNVSGTKPASGSNWVISFDTTFNASTGDNFEVCTNSGSINYTDTRTRTVSVPQVSMLCKTGKGTVPKFREVAP